MHGAYLTHSGGSRTSLMSLIYLDSQIIRLVLVCMKRIQYLACAISDACFGMTYKFAGPSAIKACDTIRPRRHRQSKLHFGGHTIRLRYAHAPSASIARQQMRTPHPAESHTHLPSAETISQITQQVHIRACAVPI